MIQNSPKAFAYIVQADDSFKDLADRYGTTEETILSMNPMIDPHYLVAGQVIAMPGDPPSARGPRFQQKCRAELDRRRRRETKRRRRSARRRRTR